MCISSELLVRALPHSVTSPPFIPGPVLTSIPVTLMLQEDTQLHSVSAVDTAHCG